MPPRCCERRVRTIVHSTPSVRIDNVYGIVHTCFPVLDINAVDPASENKRIGGAITRAKIAEGAVGGAAFAAGSVTSAKLADKLSSAAAGPRGPSALGGGVFGNLLAPVLPRSPADCHGLILCYRL